jgi:hypothetical protein
MSMKRLVVTAVAVLALASCSDDGDDSSTATTYERVPIDVASASDTPFCQAYVKQVQTIEAAAENEGGDRNARELLSQLKAAASEMANSAPAEIKADVEQFNQAAQSAADWGAFLFEQPPEAQATARINQYVSSNCNLDAASIGEQLQAKGQKECELRKQRGADVGGMC